MPVDTEKIKALAQRIRQAGYSGVREARRSLLNREKVRDRVLPVITSGNEPTRVLKAAWKQYRDPNSSSEKYIEDMQERVNDIRDRGERYDYELSEAEGDLRMAKQHEDAKRLYLGYPAKYGTMEPSPYQPTIGAADNPYQVNPLLSDEEFEYAVFPTWTSWKTGTPEYTSHGESRIKDLGKTALIKDFPYLSDMTMSEGHDDKGHYISLYDIWDYNTSISGKPGDNIGRIVGGKPVEIYQRYYLDDWLDIPEKDRGNHFLAPATITEYVDTGEDEYRKGGKIHIKPSKKGTFTAAAKKHGKSVQAFASQVLANKENYSPAMVKKARFAKAAAGWRHGDGGLIERFGVDAVREALKRRNAHIYDGVTEETQQMNYEIPSVAAYAAQTPMLYSSQNGLMLQELPAAGIVETAPASAYRINRESPYQIAVEVPQEDVQIPYAIEPSVKNEFFIPENYKSIVKPMLSQAQQALSPRDVVGFARPDLTNGEEQQLQFADYAKAAEALGSNKNKLIEQQVNSLKNGEDLREFQKMLLQNGYYRDLPTPTITAKTKAEVTALQQKLIDAGYNLGPKGADGVIGDYTRAAWKKYVKDHPDEALLEYVADGKIGRRTRAAARLYYKDITKIPDKKQEEEKPVETVQRAEELLPQINLDSIVPTSGLALRMSQNISDKDRKRNRYTLYPEHGINQLVGTLASERGNAAADSVEAWQARLQQAIAAGDSTEIANSRQGLMQARSGLLHVPGRKSLTKAEQQQALAILTSLNGDKPMTYEDYVAYCNKLGKKPGSWLGTGATSSDANGAKVPLYGGRSSYGFTNQVEDAAGNIESFDAEHGYRTENGRIVDSLGNPLTRKQQLMRTDARIYTDPNRGRLGGWSWRVTENGDIEISDNFEATDQTAAKGRNDDSAYNEARASWKRGTTHPLRHTIKKEKYEELVKRALDSLTINK